MTSSATSGQTPGAEPLPADQPEHTENPQDQIPQDQIPHDQIPQAVGPPATPPSTPQARQAPPSAPPASALLDHVSKRFGDVQAVDDLSLTVDRGTLMGVIGPSGSGKTTMIRILTGAIPPDAGSVRVLGQDPTRLRRAVRERIGYMPQSFTLYPDLTARENVDFVASLFGLLPFRRWRRTREALLLVDLWSARGTRAADLSGGMQRRLELACALVHEPELLFLDEPTAGIDPLLRATVWEELHRLRDAGRTLLVTTQYVTEAAECDRVVLIADGRVIADGTPDELRRRAADGEVLELETRGPVDPALLEETPGVGSVHSTGFRSLRLQVADAAQSTPTIISTISDAGGEVVRVEEVRPSFDEVFAALVERAREAGSPPTADRRTETAAESAA